MCLNEWISFKTCERDATVLKGVCLSVTPKKAELTESCKWAAEANNEVDPDGFIEIGDCFISVGHRYY